MVQAATQYSQDEIDAVVHLLNTGQVTVEQLEQQYGIPAAEIQANLDQINSFNDLTADTIPDSISAITAEPPLPMGTNVQFDSVDPNGTITVTGSTGGDVVGGSSSGVPGGGDTGGTATAGGDEAGLGGLGQTSDEGTAAASQEEVEALITNVKDSPYLTESQKALRIASIVSDQAIKAGMPEAERLAALEAVWKDFGVDVDLSNPPDNATAAFGVREDSTGLIDVAQIADAPVGGSTSAADIIASILGAVGGAVANGDSTSGGTTNTADNSASGGTPQPTAPADDTVADSGVNPFDQEHPWRYDGNGTFTNVLTGEATTAAVPDGVVFVEGEQYSVGDSGAVLDPTGGQVASITQNDQGINVFVTPTQAATDGTNTTATGGTNTTGTSGTGGGMPAPTTTPTTPTGGSAPTTDGAGDGDGSGDGPGTTNNIAVVAPAATPIVDGMFADFVPKFRRQIGRNILNPNFRS